jgi:hypothetical protein
MPTLEMHPLRSAMQFRLTTFRYPIPVFDGAHEVSSEAEDLADLMDEIVETTTEFEAAGTWPQADTTTTPQVPLSCQDEVRTAAVETTARKGGQAR